jgi:hypothetical protein
MGRRKLAAIVAIVASALVVLALIGTGLLLRPPEQPAYQGKRLKEWLPSLDDLAYVHVQREGASNSAPFAFKQMGGKAIPYLIHELRVRDGHLKLKLLELAKKQSLIRINFTPAATRHKRALGACIGVGPPAAAAIPEITRLLDEQGALSVRTFAVIGPAALPALTAALTNRTIEVRRAASGYFCSALVSWDAEAAVPALLERVRDPREDAAVRIRSAMALGYIAKRPDLAVPVLSEALRDKDEDEGLREAAKWALTRVRYDRK